MWKNTTSENEQILGRLKTIKEQMNAVVNMMENERHYDEIIIFKVKSLVYPS